MCLLALIYAFTYWANESTDCLAMRLLFAKQLLHRQDRVTAVYLWADCFEKGDSCKEVRSKSICSSCVWCDLIYTIKPAFIIDI